MAVTAVVALLLLLGVCRASHPKPSCRYPPSEWCRSLEIATACKVQKQCMEMNAIRQYPPAPKVNVTLYYESLCPYSRWFLTLKLLPTYILLSDIMEVKLVPYGNTQVNTAGSFVCQHGQDECDLDMITACVLHYLEDYSFKFWFVECLLSSTNILKDAKMCFETYTFYRSWEDVLGCFFGPEGMGLMHKYANDTRALRPQHTYVPWVTINGEHTDSLNEKAHTSLFLLVCDLYKGVKPGICTGSPTHLNRGYTFA
ncbi:gamma-interferon-inducible lysosomal thiol reductase-like [Nelusetta ayraudi]|uniref:gamma-interferon-inducible lysosomal thiol reductase-like n=1 Tax=Nelusetta ayraudi TaxID=303726 RepID=UPI003F6FEE35